MDVRTPANTAEKITSCLDDYYVTESIGNPEENDEDESMRKRMLYQCLDVILDEIKLRCNENQWLYHASEPSPESPRFFLIVWLFFH